MNQHKSMYKGKRLFYCNPNIISDISKKLKIFSKSPRYSFNLVNSSKLYLEKESINHSYQIEFPSTKINKSSKLKSNLLENMSSAYYWGRSRISKNNFNEAFIMELAARIDPETHNNHFANYRTISVRPEGSSFTPPYAEKIPEEMGKYVFQIKSMLSDPQDIHQMIDCAAFAHLHLCRIHPFEDSNGRTSRMVQNLILHNAKLPPAIIYEGERHFYFQLIESAQNAWRSRDGQAIKFPSKEETEFFNFVASKVSTSLDKLIEVKFLNE